MSVTLRRVDPAENMFRFYRLDLQRDLFGASCVLLEWGRIGAAGRTRTMPYPTAAEAETALHRQRRAKERRGYE